MYFTRIAEEVGQLLQQKSFLLTTAESCTGGMVGAAITAIAGSSAWYDRGFVTYSNEAKMTMLGVNPRLIAHCGAVSEPVAIAMAEGALKHSLAHASVAVTGVAGPTGGSAEKPVGLVWFAFAVENQATCAVSRQFKGDRASIRAQACQFALTQLLEVLISG